MPLLFVYGTLQHPPLLAQLLGRVPAMTGGTVVGFRAAPMRSRVYPGLVSDPAAEAPGKVLLDVTERELAVLDAFEGDAYARVVVVARTSDGEVPCDAWQLRESSRHLAGPGTWSFERFLLEDVDDFLGGSRAGSVHPGATD